jgi:hypothetical protein
VITRAQAKLIDQFRCHLPGRKDEIVRLSALSAGQHIRSFKDRSKFWDVAFHVADALQAERSGDSFIASLFYSQAAREILDSGEHSRSNLLWAAELSSAATMLFVESGKGPGTDSNGMDIEIKHNLENLEERVANLLKRDLPNRRD